MCFQFLVTGYDYTLIDAKLQWGLAVKLPITLRLTSNGPAVVHMIVEMNEKN